MHDSGTQPASSNTTSQQRQDAEQGKKEETIQSERTHQIIQFNSASSHNYNSGGGVEQSLDIHTNRYCSDNTKDIEASLHIEDTKPFDLFELHSPLVDATQELEERSHVETDSPKGTSIRKRLQALTTASRSSTEPDRQSWESISSSNNDTRAWSVTTQDTGSTGISTVSTSTITQNPKRKKKKNKGSSKRKDSGTFGLKFLRSPGDYMQFDLDYCEAQIAMSNKEPECYPEIGKASAEELLTYLRRMTGTQVRAIPASDLEAPRRPNESRAWDHRNLWCVDCRKSCPICNTTCCVKEELAQKAANESLDPEKVHQAKRLRKIIEHLGTHAKDVSTFAQCTPPDGCGRYVCASCSGVCPSEICRDIQCKECKPDPWASCDWHD
ncbi:uncharacterized protein APUU_10441S [Aspergillus puulaauensis]|uniref:Uncharacterized protein n=1 Tax=Aspergillus puulaauensis TaxID=1220207 RepID=A0A7R7XAR0_9EURO|nr:uncharacterized protein APUU_10441S [Aspergillus puulaauensis]BCS17613.1 hypothetical protein APUU_10441S [Aspergillus puulaauensis]